MRDNDDFSEDQDGMRSLHHHYASDSGVAPIKTHSLGGKSKNPYRKKEKPLRQMITTVNVAR